MDVPLPAQMHNMHYTRDAAHFADYDGTDTRFGTVLDPHRGKGAGKATTMTVCPLGSWGQGSICSSRRFLKQLRGKIASTKIEFGSDPT